MNKYLLVLLCTLLLSLIHGVHTCNEIRRVEGFFCFFLRKHVLYLNMQCV